MLHFLRKIRRSLITSSASRDASRRYILYALGEIGLVVIGILIALQINNWNEARKQRNLEKNLLIELRNTIIDDFGIVEMAINGNIETQKSCAIILRHLEQKLPYHDSLALHFENANQWWKILIRKNAFEKAKLFGLDFIENDHTRNQLSDLYEKTVSFGETLDDRQTLYYNTTVAPILLQLFESIDLTWYVPKNGNIPLDYDSLLSNELYKSILRTSIGQRGYYNEWLDLTLSNMRELDKRLLTEIEAR
jgi:hypothetical protein